MGNQDVCDSVREVSRFVGRGVGHRVAAPGTISLAFRTHEETTIVGSQVGFLNIGLRIAIAGAVVRLIAHERAELDDRFRIASILHDERGVDFVQRVAGRPEKHRRGDYGQKRRRGVFDRHFHCVGIARLIRGIGIDVGHGERYRRHPQWEAGGWRRTRIVIEIDSGGRPQKFGVGVFRGGIALVLRIRSVQSRLGSITCALQQEVIPGIGNDLGRRGGRYKEARKGTNERPRGKSNLRISQHLKLLQFFRASTLHSRVCFDQLISDANLFTLVQRHWQLSNLFEESAFHDFRDLIEVADTFLSHSCHILHIRSGSVGRNTILNVLFSLIQIGSRTLFDSTMRDASSRAGPCRAGKRVRWVAS